MAPVVQGTIGNQEITGHLRLGFPTLLHSLYGFQFEFLRKGAQLFWHAVLPLETLFQLYLLRKVRQAQIIPISLRCSGRIQLQYNASRSALGLKDRNRLVPAAVLTRLWFFR